MTKEIYTLKKWKTKWWDAEEAYTDWCSDFNKADEDGEIKEMIADFIEEKAFTETYRLDKNDNLIVVREWLDDDDYMSFDMRSEFQMFQIRDELENLGWEIEIEKD